MAARVDPTIHIMFVCYYYWVIVYVLLGIILNSCIDPIYIGIDNRITQLLLTISVHYWLCPNIVINVIDHTIYVFT